MSQNNSDKIKSKIQKLLNQAADRQGTPEGETFERKAFKLMAEYGVEQRDLPKDGEEIIIVMQEYNFTGSYMNDQISLMHHIATALHCTGFAKRTTGRQCDTYVLFGQEDHAERVDMLFSILSPQMAALAMDDSNYPVLSGASTVSRRKAFMSGFCAGIHQRITEAESNIADAQGGEGDNSYAVVLVNDKNDAEDEMNEFFKEQNVKLSKGSQRKVTDASSFRAGSDAAKRTDIGQTRVSRSKELIA